MNNSNDVYSRVALDAYYELNWELTPGEVRDNIDYQARVDIAKWLDTGSTEQFSWMNP